MIHTRQQLLRWIEEYVKDCVLVTALGTGTVEVLGGFNPLPASRYCGFLVRVKARFGSQHYIAVANTEGKPGCYHWYEAPGVQWDRWIGSDNPYGYCILDGDNPCEYFQLKKKAIMDMEKAGN